MTPAQYAELLDMEEMDRLEKQLSAAKAAVDVIQKTISNANFCIMISPFDDAQSRVGDATRADRLVAKRVAGEAPRSIRPERT